MLYRNKDSGIVHRLIARALDATTARAGTPVAVYCPEDDEHSVFVCDAVEFKERFEALNPNALEWTIPHP